MSTATATGALPATGKKKLVIILAAVVLLVVVGGVAALMLLKGKATDDYDDEYEADDRPVATAQARRPGGAAPTYLPLDVFTVNLADREAERFAQVGITLELTDTKSGDQIKAHMPAVRNRILLAIADRTAVELSTREGKTRLADTVKRETARALGYDVPDPEEVDEEALRPGQRARRRPAEPALPIVAVHFANFIVQ